MPLNTQLKIEKECHSHERSVHREGFPEEKLLHQLHRHQRPRLGQVRPGPAAVRQILSLLTKGEIEQPGLVMTMKPFWI